MGHQFLPHGKGILRQNELKLSQILIKFLNHFNNRIKLRLYMLTYKYFLFIIPSNFLFRILVND